MQTTAVIEQYFNLLLTGDRVRVRHFVGRVLASGVTPAQFANDVIWPVHETLFKHHRRDEVCPLAFNYALRLLRTTVDQLQSGYEQAPRRGESVLLFGGREEIDDLGGQLAADFLEAAGWDVWFGGPLPATDDVVAEVHSRRPKWLVMFSPAKEDTARAREVIHTVRSIGGHPDLLVALGGGIFNRAPGLAEELGADASASTPFDLADELASTNRRATASRRGLAASCGSETPTARHSDSRRSASAADREGIAFDRHRDAA